MIKNEDLWGELKRLNDIWGDIDLGAWGEYKPLSSDIECSSELYLEQSIINLEAKGVLKMVKNKQLWGELTRFGDTWGKVSIDEWGDYKPLTSNIEGMSNLIAQGVNIEHSMSIIKGIAETQIQGVNVEFSPCLISNDVEMIVSVSVSKRDYKNNMISYLPRYERKSKVINNIYDSITKDLKRLEFNINDMEENLFIDTTISEIERWEKVLGIKPNNTKKYDFRREKIKSKLRANGTTTKQMIANISSAFSNGEVEVIEDNTNYKFIVKFTGVKGIPENMVDLNEILEEIKPAHLGYEFAYTYNNWNTISSNIWNSLKTETWDSVTTI